MSTANESAQDFSQQAQNAGRVLANKAGEAKETLKDQASGLRDSASKFACDAMQEAKRVGQETLEKVSGSSSKTIDEVEKRVKDQPMNSVLIAGGIGLLCGLYLARR